jgi:protein KTI12
MNYIKGFRYQLYCEAKAVQTPNCIVQVGTQPDQCRKFNEAALENASSATPTSRISPPYEPAVFDNLIFRYEEPNAMARWDAPLFAVPFEDEAPDYQAIWDALVGSDGKSKVVRPNAATVMKPASEQNYLYELDKSTSDVISAITAWTADHPGEGGVAVRVGDKLEIELPVTPPSLAQLQRLRRQFIQLNRQHNLSKARLKAMFVGHLNDAFEQ